MHKTQLIKHKCAITLVILWPVKATVFQVIYPLTPNGLYSGHAVSPLNS